MSDGTEIHSSTLKIDYYSLYISLSNLFLNL